MKAVVECKKAFPRVNNIDLLRLFAATQVVFIHAAEHIYHVPRTDNGILMALSYIPGVPIFFFLSGLLIPQSYARSASLEGYIWNRVLRLYPALLVCMLLTILMLISTGYMGVSDLLLPKVAAWLITQSTFLQFYNPDFFYGFGTGVINSSLWTISVEVQFYLATPLLVFLLRYKPLYITLFIASLVVNIVFHLFDLREFMIGKFLGVSFLPWIYMFMAGQLASLYWNSISRFFDGKALVWIAIFATQTGIFIVIQQDSSFHFSGNSILPTSFFVLAGLVLALSVTRPDTARRVLRGNDISYGAYIYHMPIINLFLFLSIPASFGYSVLAIGIILGMAYLSWVLIERPALRLKNVSIMPR